MGSPDYQPRDFGNHRVEIFLANKDVELAIYDFAVAPSPSPRILVLKLDHLGDFLIGLPALMELRAIFPKGHITLIWGHGILQRHINSALSTKSALTNTFLRLRIAGVATLSKTSIGLAKFVRATSILPWIYG